MELESQKKNREEKGKNNILANNGQKFPKLVKNINYPPKKLKKLHKHK